MNEMQLLARLGEDVEPDPAALLRARRRLLRHASESGPRRHVRVRRMLVGVVAAVAATLAMLVLPTTRGEGGAEAAAARVLDRAAEQAAATAASNREWLLVRSDTTRWTDGEPERDLQETWVPADPTRDPLVRDPEGPVHVQPLDLPAIATDPDADVDEVYAWLMRDKDDLRGAEAAFERAVEALAEDAIPYSFKARLFEAIKRIDGVRVVSESGDFVGRDAVLLGRSEGGEAETQLAFDGTTGRFIGFQEVTEDGERLAFRTIVTVTVVAGPPPAPGRD